MWFFVQTIDFFEKNSEFKFVKYETCLYLYAFAKSQNYFGLIFMINENCVLILGAGASAPYGFPTGVGLKRLICSNFQTLWEKFVFDRTKPPFTDIYLEEQKKIARQFVSDFKNFDHDSIDLFLDIFKEHSDIGKKAIYLTILDAERNNKMKGKVQEWYTELFKLMIGSSDNYFKLSENNISIVTFNYDRSLEYYFYNIFMNFTKSIEVKEKIEELRKIKIFHVYGKLADLPWESENNHLDYGGNLWMDQLITRKNNIKTIFERRENIEALDPIVKSIQLADKIYYMGFGFARENVEIISLDRHIRPDQLVYVSDYDNRHIRLETQMRGLGIWQENRTTIVIGGDCKRVIEDYLF